LLAKRPIILCIDETGDKKAGKTTDYVAKQYIGNLGKTANGIVPVNAYAVVDGNRGSSAVIESSRSPQMRQSLRLNCPQVKPMNKNR
jgi:SRSO17 transposase